MTENIAEQETLTFRAEVQQLLNILANSLYTDREIFLRELISNASDALHRIQFEMLTNRDVLDPDADLEIHIDVDEDAHTLTVSDTGVGMTREELVENLGTIAHSGVAAFLKGIEEGERPADIIGQFGVGFYSVFTVADEVTVTTRSYRPDAEAWRWTSQGEGSFTLEPAEKEGRGTTIEIALKDDATQFASTWRVREMVKTHSDYVSFPILLDGEVVNQQTALWRKLPQEVEEDAYADLYRQLTLDTEDPLLHIHLVTDVPVDIRSILYVPRTRDRGFLNLRQDAGLRLYAKKILIQEDNQDLLPEYLGFVEGVVDSESLPLNISRETVQRSRAMRHIEKALTGRVLKGLRGLAEDRPDDYAAFWEAFGPFIKQGAVTDYANQADLLPLLRFPSSTSDGALVALEDYVARMPENQEAIYYVVADDAASAAHSPHLDAFRRRGLEVLYFLDPVDGLLARAVGEYEEKPLKDVSDPDLSLPAEEEEGGEEEGVPQEDLDRLIARFEEILGDQVSEVRASRLLIDSPCRLVSSQGGPERDLQRLRRLVGEEAELPPMILEVNRRHPLIRDLSERIAGQSEDNLVEPIAQQLFDNLLLLEGLHPNPARMVPRLQTLLEAATGVER
jgi:molecular chaperone HtpG